MNYDDLWYSIRRTVIPILVGWVLAQGARYGFSIQEGDLTGIFEAVGAGVYYTIVRWIEMKFPEIGILLGAMKKPRYEDDPKIVEKRTRKAKT